MYRCQCCLNVSKDSVFHTVMKITKIGLIVISLIILIAVFVAQINRLISVNFSTVEEIHQKKNSKHASDLNINMGDSPDHLMWFMQISDLHISLFHDPGRITDLQDFCDNTVSAVKPSIVLASGDLTDAKEKNHIGSKQQIDEWQKYRSALTNCKSLQSTVWLDIRGNHDNFDVPGWDSERNLYRKYSMHGEGRSYAYTVKDRSGSSYKFLGLDACPSQGLKRPFNFIGILSDSEYSLISKLAAEPQVNYTIWFGHYPTSCILNSPHQVRELIGNDDSSLAFLCGHLHTMGGLVKEMYTIQKEGFLELELADWKDKRIYRVAAVDYGLFSFVDVKHNEWPVVLITNPKSALFSSPAIEPLNLIENSTHIRVLVYSVDEIVQVQARLDEGDWVECKHIDGPLYVAPWQPQLYLTGMHHIDVEAKDKGGRVKSTGHQFSLDGTRVNFSILSRLSLMTNFTSLFQILFGLGLVGCVVPLCLLRYFNHLVLNGKMALPRWRSKLLNVWLRRLWTVSNIDRIFYPLVLYPVYVAVGPWSVGELIDGYVGIIFAWGTYINSTFLPGAFTYAYAFLQLLLFEVPLILIVSHQVDTSVGAVVKDEVTFVGKLVWAMSSGGLALLLTSQLLLAFSFWLAYGSLALLLGPFRICPLIIIPYTWLVIRYMPKEIIMSASRVWIEKEKTDTGLSS